MGSIAIALVLVKVIPTGYVPLQDKQYLVAFAQLPPGSSLERTEKVIEKMSEIGLSNPGVANAVAFPGLSISGFSNSSNAGIVFFTLKAFEERTSDELYGPAIANQLMGQLNGAIPDAFVGVFPPPPVNGLGSIGGFKIQLEDRGDLGDKALYEAVKAVTGKAYQTPQLAGVFSGFEINVPQLYANLDRAKAKQLGVDITDIFNVMQVGLGSLYINDFNKFGRTYQVVAQNDAAFRQTPQDILEMKVRSRTTGNLVALGNIMQVEPSFGPDRSMRYNLFRTADINAGPAPGVSSGQAQAAIEKILKETLPPGISYEYTELAYQQIITGDTTLYIFALCVVLVFMVLAAQYESLVLPLAIIMIVPVVLLCGMFGIWATGGDNNIFSQIGLIVLVGLACKNAILIVEFARELELAGMGIVESALEACRIRLRPILMTSFAFIMGVAPLAISTGAGAEMRKAIGITVFSGMLGITLLGLFLTPMFYVLLRKASGGKPLHHTGGSTLAAHAAPVTTAKPVVKKAKSHE